MSLSRGTCLTVSVVLYLIAFIYNHSNTFMDVKDYQVRVVQKYSGISEGKYGSLTFIVVYETSDHQYFDRNVSASYFTRVNTGEQLTIQLRPFDISQSPKDNFIWFFGWILSMLLCYSIGTLFLVLALFDKLRVKFFS